MYQVNRRAVFGMRLIGCGYKALCHLSSALDMPLPMSKSTFHKHQAAVSTAVTEVGKASMKRAASTVLEHRRDEAVPGDVPATTDGTWMRRGYSSLYGVQTVLS